MPWVKFSDDHPDRREIRRLSNAAYRVGNQAVFFSAKHLTDGRIEVEDLEDVASPVKLAAARKAVGELVKAGLWREVPGGWELVGYLDDQPSRERVLADRTAKAERQRRWLDNARRARNTSSGATPVPPPETSTDTTGDASQDTPETRPESGLESHPRTRPRTRTVEPPYPPPPSTADKRVAAALAAGAALEAELAGGGP